MTSVTGWYSSQYSEKNVGEQLVYYINLGHCYLDAETVPIYNVPEEGHSGLTGVRHSIPLLSESGWGTVIKLIYSKTSISYRNVQARDH